jgi:general secretion pathway protein D
LALACLLFATVGTPVWAGPGSSGSNIQTAAHKEIARREALVNQSQTLHTQAALHYEKGEYEEAMRLYRQSWDSLPQAPFTAELKDQARDGYSRAANAQAKKLADTGRYAESRAVLESILKDNFDPNNAEAQAFSQKLNDPDRFEPALTPEHLDKAGKVDALLREAYSFINLGDYDNANRRFMDVLRIDSYNSAARRGMEQAEMHRGRYFETARDHTRAKALNAVNQAWEAPLADVSNLFGGTPLEGTGVSMRDSISTRLRTLMLPRVTLQDASLEEVVEFLRIRSREVDPAKRGVDFVLKVPAEARNKTITLDLSEIPLDEVLRYATQNTGTVYRVDDYAVTITSLTERDATLVTRTYRVPPDFISNAPIDNAAAAPANPFDPAATSGNALTVRRLGAREVLEQRGIPFPEGSSANYQPSSSTLIVRNTAENLALVENVVEQAQSSTPKQVEIQVRMIEVNETRLGELGFDWLLGQFDVPGANQRLFGGGGNVGNQRSANFSGEEFPFVNNDGSPVGINPITAGLRSSGTIQGVPSIDALLGRITTKAVDSRSPGQFAVSGVFTDPQFQTVIRSLAQSKGVDFLASPSVVAKSGQRATITVGREFRYPTEFDPPQIPQTVNGSGAPVTPSTPTAFEMRDVGILLEVEPLIGADNRTVELSLVPSSTEFEGFINYGAPISTSVPTLFGDVPFDVPNNILQPVFRLNKVNTSVTIWDGQTVVLGGVMFEKVHEINDKVPLLGDVPIVGRAFQSKVKQSERKNVLFFVTVKVIDPAGNRVISSLPEATAAAR